MLYRHPLQTGGDRKALTKEIAKSRVMATVFAARSAEKRRWGPLTQIGRSSAPMSCRIAMTAAPTASSESVADNWGRPGYLWCGWIFIVPAAYHVEWAIKRKHGGTRRTRQ